MIIDKLLPLFSFFIFGIIFTILGLYGLIKHVPYMKKIGIVNLGPFGGQYPIFRRNNPKEFKIWFSFWQIIYFIFFIFGVFFLIFPFILYFYF